MPKRQTIAMAKYDKTHRRTYGFRLHNEIDADIIKKLASVPSMQGYIKQLIREDIMRDSAPDLNTQPVQEPAKKRTKTEKKKLFRIKPEYIHLWGEEATTDTVLTEEEVSDIARGWDVPVVSLMGQLEQIK